MNCPKCNKTLVDKAEFCPFCGNDLKQNEDYLQKQHITNQVEQSITKTNNKFNKSKRDLLIIIGVLLVVIIGIVLAVKSVIGYFNKESNDKNASNSNTVSIVKDEYGTAKFIDGKFTNLKVKSEDDAYKALDSLKKELNFNNVKDEFVVESVESSENITYYKFHQKYKDIEVYGINLIISVDRNGNVLGMSGYYIPGIDIDVNGKKTKAEAEEIVKQDLGNNNVTIVESNKYIYADNEYTDLIYIIDAYSDEKILEYIIDANTNEIIDSSEVVEYASAYEFNGKGINGQVSVTIEEFYDIDTQKNRYRLVDPNRNIEIVDGSFIGKDLAGVVISGILSPWTPMVGDLDGINFKYLNGQGENKELAEIGISALKNFEEIYDYYKNVLGRKSYDNKGGKIVVNVGMRDKTFGKEQLQNAAWLSLTNQMYIGYWNGTSLAGVKDVLAHEMTHGVISKTAKFASLAKRKEREKAFETGSLNEGFADILGSLIEGKNWTINEDIEVLRSLSNPTAYSNPSVKGGQYYYPDGYLNDNRTLEQFLKDNNLSSVADHDDGGKHQNATVPGHAAYLMYTNGAFSSREQMAKVWYNSLFLLSSYSNFEDCALAVIKTAENLGLSSNSVKIIEKAFLDTKMLEPAKIEINGTVTGAGKKISNVKMELKAKDDYNEDYTFTTDKNGSFSGEIKEGTYEITVTKDGFEEYKETVTIYGDTTINVELAKKNDNKNSLRCKSGNCHTLTIYVLENTTGADLKETPEKIIVDHGTVIGIGGDMFVDELSDTFGEDFIKFDGETFEITMSGFTVDIAWYYKGTNTKFDFNKPITEDVEIEMKVFDGLLDNDLMEDIYDIFNP